MKALADRSDTRYGETNWADPLQLELGFGFAGQTQSPGSHLSLDVGQTFHRWLGESCVYAISQLTECVGANTFGATDPLATEHISALALASTTCHGAIVQVMDTAGQISLDASQFRGIQGQLDELGRVAVALGGGAGRQVITILTRLAPHKDVPATPGPLQLAIARIERMEPFSPSDELLQLARKAVAERPSREGEDIKEWARRLSQEAREPLD